MSNRKPANFLDQTASRLKAFESEITKLDGKLVEQDIAARRIEANIGWEFARQVDQIEAALKAAGIKLNVDQWCKQNLGVDISTMRRRKRLYRFWAEYEAKRREMGQCGQSGLLFALSLVSDIKAEPERSGEAMPVLSRSATKSVRRESPKTHIAGCQLIIGDALAELPKLPVGSVSAIVTSPPYWPSPRAYGGKGLGFEKTVEEYLAALVAIFHEAKPVLRDDGTLWVNIDDSYKDGNLLFIPARLAMAMQDDGWVCRSEIVWCKKGGGKPDSVANRPVKDYEKVLMFTKNRRGYHYDGDPIRVPLKKPYSTPGRKKLGMLRNDIDRTERVWSNPMGRTAGSVWEIAPSSYAGGHSATMPAELVQRCLSVSCPENGLVLDPFGGAGTTALVALQMGLRAISIEISEDYSKEARERLSAALETNPLKLAAD
jgi:DNA modification methylase